MAVRTFTVYPHTVAGTENPQDGNIAFGIRANYPEPQLQRRYGALEVCRGWTREEVLAQFRKVHRHDAAAVLGRDLSASHAVQIEMEKDELRLWNN